MIQEIEKLKAENAKLLTANANVNVKSNANVKSGSVEKEVSDNVSDMSAEDATKFFSESADRQSKKTESDIADKKAADDKKEGGDKPKSK